MKFSLSYVVYVLVFSFKLCVKFVQLFNLSCRMAIML